MMVGFNSNSSSLVDIIPKNSVGAEIGVWRGDSSELFLKKTSPDQLYLVDPWSFSAFAANLTGEELQEHIKKYSVLTGSTDPKDFDRYYDSVYQAVVRRFQNNKNVRVCRSTSADWFDTFDQKLDWIYIDGDHTYTGCLYDLTNCLKVMKPKGIIFGDDYGNKVEVKRAVDDFISSRGLELKIYGKNQFAIGL